MASKERVSLGFGDELDDIDPSAWAKPKPRDDKPTAEATRQAAEATGFRSREPARGESIVATPRQQRRRRTGRTAQLNLKLRPETIEAFIRVADANGWGLGEAFERAVMLLEQSTVRE